MSYYSKRTNVYQEIAVQTASPARLVLMLYEGAIRFLRQAVDAIQAKDLNQKRQSIDRVVAIIQHLHDTLDTEKGGQVAADLDRLYTYIMSRVLDGSGKLETAPLEEATKLLGTLLSGWEEVVKKEQEHSVPTDLLAQQASHPAQHPAQGGRFTLHA